MMKAFTRNYDDHSTDAGFQFTFYCDQCGNGFKSSFIESTTYQQNQNRQGLTRGAGLLGNLLGGRGSDLGWAMERAGDLMQDRFGGQSPQWQREHEAAFNQAQNEARAHFRKCPACQKWVCSDCYNEEEGLCVDCAPRQDVYVAQARSQAMRRNIDEVAQTATVWQGQLERKTTVCPACGHPAGSGKFCNSCGAPLGQKRCPSCGAVNAPGTRFCGNCGSPVEAAVQPAKQFCGQCGAENAPGTRFCGQCGAKL